MQVNQLMQWVDEPDTHRKVVGDYAGGYALGVTDDPPAFLLRVEPGDTAAFPREVDIHGQKVPVVVHGQFARPVPTAGRR